MVLGSILCLLGDIFLALGSCGECQKIKKTVEVEAENDEEAFILAAADEDIDDFGRKLFRSIQVFYSLSNVVIASG